MNQKLLPFALSALALASPAFAADDTKAAPAVTVYGLVHLSVDMLDYTDNRDTPADFTDDKDETNLAISSNSSRFGIKGERALTDSTTIMYLAEWLIGATEETKANGNNNNLSRRNQWVGLRTSYGDWRIGRLDTPLKNLRGKIDMFYSDQLGENRSITSATGLDSRLDNVIQFDLGRGELRGVFYYSADRGSDSIDDNDNDAFSAAISWEPGPLFLGAGIEKRSYGAADRSASDTLDDTDAVRLVASYAFGDNGSHKLAGYFETVDSVNGGDNDRDTYGIGYSFKSGDNLFKAGYYIADELSEQDDTGGSQLSVGWDRQYGKNVQFYVTAAVVRNDDNASFKVIGVGHDGELNSAAGEDNSGISAGVRYQF